MDTHVTAGRDNLGEFAPTFAALNDDVLFGQVWSRQDALSARDRSLVTITTLIASGITGTPLQHHMQLAKDNGITQEEIAEILTHFAFYGGWPKAWQAFGIAQEIWKDTTDTDATK